MDRAMASPEPLEQFTANLQREAAALGIVPPLSPLEAARGPTPSNYLQIAQTHAPKVTYRAQMLPYAEYDDGSYRFGTTYPQIIPDTWEAIQKMGRAAQSAFGANYAPEDVMPTAQDAGLIAGLAMTGAGGFGAFGKSVSGRAPAQVEAAGG